MRTIVHSQVSPTAASPSHSALAGTNMLRVVFWLKSVISYDVFPGVMSWFLPPFIPAQHTMHASSLVHIHCKTGICSKANDYTVRPQSLLLFFGVYTTMHLGNAMRAK